MSASPYLPLPVVDGEYLYRQLLDLIILDEQKRELKPTNFNDINTWGLSVNRIAYSTVEIQIKAAIHRVEKSNLELIQSKPIRTFIKFVRFSTLELRAAMADEEIKQRLYAIFDTATCSDSSHADVFCIGAGLVEKYHKSRARAILFEKG